MRDGDNYPESFGPYLRYAISTGFRNFALLDRNPPSFDRSRRDLFFLVKFHKAGQAEDFARDLQAIAPGNPEFRVEYGPEEKNFQHVTMLAGRAVLGSETFGTWDGYVSRVELSLPVRPTSADKILQRDLIQRWSEFDFAPARSLIGVLDDGCPFAAANIFAISAGREDPLDLTSG